MANGTDASTTAKKNDGRAESERIETSETVYSVRGFYWVESIGLKHRWASSR